MGLVRTHSHKHSLRIIHRIIAISGGLRLGNNKNLFKEKQHFVHLLQQRHNPVEDLCKDPRIKLKNKNLGHLSKLNQILYT